MRFLNGFILIGIILLFISIAGVASGNRFLTEPGQQPNPYAWLEYLGAAALMLVNGVVSIYNAKQQEERKPPAKDGSPSPEATNSPETAAEKH
jgi:hypothetical protein